jgi:glycosyltransferase involved in cell wall biosynthesis
MRNASTVSVVVPTYRRPRDLARCLEGLVDQTRPADQVIIVTRADDRQTLEVLDDQRFRDLPLARIVVERPGQVSALNAGLDQAHGDLIAFTDDDARPCREWIERIEALFGRYPEAGGVGGRDAIGGAPLLPSQGRTRVGTITWYGRYLGNHHVGQGPARAVHVLKGANMAYRRLAIYGERFHGGLRGDGAQVGNDMAFSISVQARGWELVYDPLVRVDHYPAARAAGADRGDVSVKAKADAAFNQTYAQLRWLGWPRRVAVFLYGLAVGTRDAPGLALFLEHVIRTRDVSGARVTTAAILRARLAASRMALQEILGSLAFPSHRVLDQPRESDW